MITGSYSPDICGVGDYTYQLMQTKIGQGWNLYYSKDWSLISVFKHIRDIKKMKSKNIIMQYPTLGYGWSLVPLLLCLYFSLLSKKHFMIVLHELSQQTLKSRVTIFLMMLFVDQIIFTNKYEQDYACKYFKYLKKKSSIVKIYSNILSSSVIKNIDERSIQLVYFGHIRPNKGIEDFVNLAQKINMESKPINVVLAGQVPKGFEEYFSKIKTNCDKYGVRILLNLPNNEISDLLNNSKIAYLPFPDGVSERRGSFLAALKNGAVVVTTKGIFTNESIEKCVVISDEKSFTVESFLDLLNDTELLIKKQSEGFFFLDSEMPKSWNQVTNMLEEQLLKND